MGRPEGLESRDAWSSNYANRYMGELQMLESLGIQGLLVDVEFVLILDLCWSMVKWRSGNSFLQYCAPADPSL